MSWSVEIWPKAWPMKEPFAIARGVQTEQATLQVSITDSAGFVGRGEACGIPYEGETPSTMQGQIETIRDQIECGVDRIGLLKILPAGGARFALDSALWDLEAKRDGLNPFATAGVTSKPVVTDLTIGIRDLQGYESTARRLADYAVLKVKVDNRDPIAAIEAVRRGAPSSCLIIDPNQSWSVAMVKQLAPTLRQLGVALLEQPIPVGEEHGLDGYTPPVPLCADELIRDVDDLDAAYGRFQMINIKLDKCGGLTAALRLSHVAEARGFRLMVGCMAGSSLAMAPAMVIAQRCDFADLDGPLLQAEDIENGFQYVNGVVAQPHIPQLWG